MQVAFAVGTKVEARIHGGGAFRAGVGQWFAHQEIDNQADETPGGYEDDDHKGPESGVHSAAAGVTIDVSNHENETREEQRHKSYHSGERKLGKSRSIPQVRREHVVSIGVVPVRHVDGEGDYQREHVERGHQNEKPSRDDAKLVPEAQVFLALAQLVQPLPLTERFRYLLLIVRHRFPLFSRIATTCSAASNPTRFLDLLSPSIRQRPRRAREPSTTSRSPAPRLISVDLCVLRTTGTSAKHTGRWRYRKPTKRRKPATWRGASVRVRAIPGRAGGREIACGWPALAAIESMRCATTARRGQFVARVRCRTRILPGAPGATCCRLPGFLQRVLARSVAGRGREFFRS